MNFLKQITNKKGFRGGKAVLFFSLIIVVGSFLAMGVFSGFEVQVSADSKTCPIRDKADRTIVHFPQDGIRSDHGFAAAQEDPVTVNIPAGNYKVTFVSFDDHSTKPSQSQPNERWFLKIFDKNGNKVLNTNSISDLPEDKNFLREVVHTHLNIPQKVKRVTKVIPFHTVFPDKTSPNSVDPICAAFDKIEPPPPPPPPPPTEVCHSANGTSLSVLEFKEAMDDGLIDFHLSINESDGKAKFTIENQTNCLAPVSLSSYKMVEPFPALSSQIFFDGTGLINIGPFATLNVDLPNCMAQVDAWYGLHPKNLLDSNPYIFPHNVPSVLDFGFTSGNLCEPPPPPPPPPAPSCTFSADPTFIEKGDSSTLSWTTKNASSASINQGIGGVSLSGSKTVSPLSNTTYTLSVQGKDGSNITCTASIDVIEPPPPPPPPPLTLSCALSANPSIIEPGGSSTLSWTTEHAVSAQIDNGIGSVSLDGTTSVSPTDTSTYTLTASNSAGDSVKCEATVTVSPAPLADVLILKDVNKNNLKKGSLFTYTLNYENSGNLDAENVTIEDTPSPTGILTGFTIISGPDHGSCSTKTNGIECNLGTLSKGDSGTVVYKATGSKVGNVSNTAVIDTSTSETDLSNNEDSESVSIFIEESPPCTVNCGGGVDQPTVVLFEKPIENLPLASKSFIYLSQVPYTGLAAGAKTTIVLLILALLSIYFSYLLVKRDVLNKVFSFVLSSNTAVKENAIKRRNVEPTEDLDSDYEIYASLSTEKNNSSDLKTKKEKEVGVLPESHQGSPEEYETGIGLLDGEKESLAETAKSMGALISDDALRIVAVVSSVRGISKESILENLIASAKKSYPREDDYLIIDFKRAERILFSVHSGVIQMFVSWLSEAESKKSFEFLRVLRNNNVSIEKFTKRVAYYFDNFYRLNIGESIDDSYDEDDLKSVSYCWNKEDLQKIVSILVNAVDESYESQEASIKLALIKVIEITEKALARKSYYSNTA